MNVLGIIIFEDRMMNLMTRHDTNGFQLLVGEQEFKKTFKVFEIDHVWSQ